MSNINAAYSSRTSPSPAPRNATLAANLLSRKRKRVEEAAPTTAPALAHAPPAVQNHFVIKPHSSSSNDAPQSFSIITTISRAQLPLTFLDNSDSISRLFISHLPDLEQPCQLQPQVLVVRKDEDRGSPLCVVERAKRGIYALCRLADWVKVDDVEKLKANPPASHCDAVDKHTGRTLPGAWWESAATTLPKCSTLSSTASEPNKEHRLSTATTEDVSAPVIPPEPLETDTTITSVDDVFVRFISQYLDTLYLSKLPLAFFAKGPVSRARAAFTTARIGSAELLDFTRFLRALILSSSSADKKYRDKLPDILKNLPLQGPDDIVPQKKRRKMKLKPDKYGMLPDEEDRFAKWWHADDANVQNDENAEQCLKRRSAQLRTRETFMQVILILEVLSIETSSEFKDRAGIARDESQVQGEESQKPINSKAKKVGDLSTTLELLLDKLGIWHSLESGLLLHESTKHDGKPKETPNELHNFCVEVVIPFYVSRIPEQAAVVNKKLGGPSTSSNSKVKSSSRKPGEPESRQRPERKPRDPLGRVASEIIHHSNKSGRTLSRSATDSFFVPGLKREMSGVPLAQIPSRTPTPAAASQRRSVPDLMRVREVDFSAIQRNNEAKLKKRAEVEEKLKEAISALKRPNRAQASKEISDVSEQRRLMAQARARTSQSLSKRSQTVHVAATPKGGHRSHNAVAATPHHIPQPAFVRAAPSSGPSLVPSSSMKPPPAADLHNALDVAVPQTGHRPRHATVEETPSRGPLRFAPLPSKLDAPATSIAEEEGEMEDDEGASPSLPRAADLLRTPSKPSRTWAMDETPSRPAEKGNWKGKGKEKAAVAGTPVKSGEKSTDETRTEPQSNIYAALGWEDDFDD
ncbi:hypothetical protein MBLNU459_g6426t2 [Dothideomycetes sp. NU459]